MNKRCPRIVAARKGAVKKTIVAAASDQYPYCIKGMFSNPFIQLHANHVLPACT